MYKHNGKHWYSWCTVNYYVQNILGHCGIRCLTLYFDVSLYWVIGLSAIPHVPTPTFPFTLSGDANMLLFTYKNKTKTHQPLVVTLVKPVVTTLGEPPKYIWTRKLELLCPKEQRHPQPMNYKTKLLVYCLKNIQLHSSYCTGKNICVADSQTFSTSFKRYHCATSLNN